MNAHTQIIPITVMETARKIVEAINYTAHDLQPPIPQDDAEKPVSPAERQALRDLCAMADLLNLPEGSWLLMPATEAILDVLAAFETEREDLEDNADREAVNEDGGDIQDEPHDGELDIAELDECDDEPSCGSLSGVPQTHWAHGRDPEVEWQAIRKTSG